VRSPGCSFQKGKRVVIGCQLQLFRRAGIPSYVHPYNCKHVGLTKAWEAGASEDQLRDVARWGKNSEQFRNHYRVKESTEVVIKLIIGEDKKEDGDEK
jgi:hypothetical protein